jgi:diadenosine tetraphosphatase ApaH/serine/threonine PP2A family protein phosphatase
MKVAIISDLHSNYEALRAVCDRAFARSVERFVCLGDCVNYGADPGPTLDLLLTLPGLVGVLGNNDAYVITPGLGETPRPLIREAAEWTRRQLKPAHLDYLGSLSYLHVKDGVTYAHASVNQPGEWPYVLEPAQARDCLAAAVTDVVFIGHVHIPCVFEMPKGGREVQQHDLGDGETVRFQPGRRYVVNVGSVGQPRDGDHRASFVMFDTQERSVTLERVAYNHASAARKIREAGLPAFFAERLEQGR